MDSGQIEQLLFNKTSALCLIMSGIIVASEKFSYIRTKLYSKMLYIKVNISILAVHTLSMI